MPSERVPLGNQGMIEILGRRMDHSQTFHDAPRAGVGRDGERDDLIELQILKTELDGGLGGFGGVTVPPVFVGQSPADLDTGREGRIEARHSQSHVADEFRDARYLDRPGAVPMPVEMGANTRYLRIALGTIENAGKVFHHARVGVEGGEG